MLICAAKILFGLIIGLILIFFLFSIFLSKFLTKLYYSVQPENPTGTEFLKDDKSLNLNPLFRHVPSLKSKIAWSELGNNFPTPIHKATVKLNTGTGKQLSFWIKREDLSSSIYGGNKVRTLQFQLPACKIHLDKNPDAKFYVLGSGGSNQIIATLLHGKKMGLDFNVGCVASDEPDLDNTLNLLSALSFKPLSIYLWDQVLPQMRLYLKALYFSNGRDKVFNAGGNSIPGVLGQIGGLLELAEQIEANELPDIDVIYLPMGSSCTSTGLILGVCLARYLKMNAFKSKKFKIVSVMIDHKMGKLHRKFNFMKKNLSKYICITPLFGILHVTKYLKEMTGIDLQKDALEFYRNSWEAVADEDFTGLYGGHSTKSRPAALLDEHINVNGPIPWLCGHFSAKSFAVMIERLEYEQDGPNVLLWQTKSNIQPVASIDSHEWDAFCNLAKQSKIMDKWANDGKAESKLRPGKVDTINGTPNDYRHIMKVVK